MAYRHCAARACLMHDVKNADYQTINGITHGRVSATFKCQYFMGGWGVRGGGGGGNWTTRKTAVGAYFSALNSTPIDGASPLKTSLFLPPS